jgi:ABC-type sugar transport system permease subunit
MLFLPQILSTMVMAALFSYLVENLIPEIVEKVFNTEMVGLLENAKTRYGTIIFYCVWVNFGGSILLYLGAMQNISDSVVEAAELDGAVGIKEFVYITFPLIFPTITTFVVVGVVGIFTEQFHVYSFYGDYANPQIYTIGYYMFSKITKGGSSMVSYPMLSAMGNIMTIIAVPLTMGIKFLMEHYGPSTEEKKHAKNKK